MVSHLMRKHKAIILWAIMVPVIVSFIFFYGWNSVFNSRNNMRPNGEDAIAVVNGQPVAAHIFRSQISRVIQQRKNFEPGVTIDDLVEDGTIDRILDQIIDQGLAANEPLFAHISFDHTFLVNQLRKDKRFQNAQGEFDPEKWNRWIEDSAGHNWNAEYAMLTQQTINTLINDRITAPARVLSSEVKQRFEENNTSMTVRYVVFDLPYTPSEEQITKFYELGMQQYEIPAQRNVQYVAIPLRGAKPDFVDALLQKARSGDDLKKLAAKYNGDSCTVSAVDLGWQTEGINVSEPMKIVFSMTPGQVSDPVEGPGGYYIFKVTDVKTMQPGGEKQVKVTQLFMRPKLTDAEKAERKKKAEKILAEAQKSGDLAAAAKAAGLTVKTTGFFTQAWDIAGIPMQDGWALSNALKNVAKGSLAPAVIDASENLYVAKVIGFKPAVMPPLEKIHDRVKADAAALLKRLPSHQDKIRKLAEKAIAECKTLDEIVKKYPDLHLSVQTVPAFTVADYHPGAGPRWNPRDVYEAVGWKPVGSLGGPVSDGLVAYVVELVDKKLPDKTTEEKFDKQKDQIRSRLLTERQREITLDYFRSKRMTAKAKGEWMISEKEKQAIIAEFRKEAQSEQATKDTGNATPAKPENTASQKTDSSASSQEDSSSTAAAAPADAAKTGASPAAAAGNQEKKTPENQPDKKKNP